MSEAGRRLTLENPRQASAAGSKLCVRHGTGAGAAAGELLRTTRAVGSVHTQLDTAVRGGKYDLGPC